MHVCMLLVNECGGYAIASLHLRFAFLGALGYSTSTLAFQPLPHHVIFRDDCCHWASTISASLMQHKRQETMQLCFRLAYYVHLPKQSCIRARHAALHRRANAHLQWLHVADTASRVTTTGRPVFHYAAQNRNTHTCLTHLCDTRCARVEWDDFRPASRVGFCNLIFVWLKVCPRQPRDL